MTEILLVDHGVERQAGCSAGGSDNPFSEVGLAQARALARRLGAEELDAIHTSPLVLAARPRGECLAEVSGREVEAVRHPRAGPGRVALQSCERLHRSRPSQGGSAHGRHGDPV